MNTGFDFNSAPRSRLPIRSGEPSPPPDFRDLQRRLGGELSHSGTRLVMPGPGHGPRDRSLSLKLEGGRLLLHSFAGDSFADCAAHIGLEPGHGCAMAPREAQAEREERRRHEAGERARKLSFCKAAWLETVADGGRCEMTPVEAYLRGRGITCAIPEVIRFHPAMRLGYDTTATSPAMVALVVAPNGEPCGLHVTAIKSDGSGKALGDRSRRMMGDMRGAAIRLAPIPPTGELAVAEGLESALAFTQLTGQPVWALMSTVFMAKWTPPAEVRALTIAADNDAPGLKAANELRVRASRYCATRIAPPPVGKDWNDALWGMAA